MPTPSRAAALSLMEEWTPSASLRKHMLSVECAMRAYAERLGQDVEAWGVAGLIHDFDYERYPNDAQAADAEHPAEGVRHLRSLGWPEEILEAVLGHAHYTGVPRVSLMAKALFAVDELTGLITACALVKPSKAVADVDVAGVRKKMKDKAFARGVNRDDVIQGAEALGVPLDEHIGVVLAAMQANAQSLGLSGLSPSAGASEIPAGGARPSTGASPDA
ncbi:MAG: HDIG domain-containing protein [Gemmatimonadaceae bacterium]|nr:HDIG domain-containing protein [Gemmatimonadaceae bacterium]